MVFYFVFLQERLVNIDNNWFRPRFLRDATKSDLEEITNYYEKLVMKYVCMVAYGCQPDKYYDNYASIRV